MRMWNTMEKYLHTGNGTRILPETALAPMRGSTTNVIKRSHTLRLMRKGVQLFRNRRASNITRSVAKFPAVPT